MIINTLRFGQLDVAADRIITMERPILGFESLRTFCLVEMDEFVPFHWLQSAQDPAVAFLVFNPVMLFADYRIEINSKEIAELEVAEASDVETYVIVTIPEDPRRMSANLQGPVLINTRNNKAKQLVLVNSEYRVKHYIFDAIDALAPRTVRREELVGV
jgi:flagellar assembly factor FliW